MLAAAALTNNAIQLVFTVIFTRLLGADGYGALAAIISAFLVLMVAGQSVQAMAARESALETLGDLAVTVRSWVRQLLVAIALLAAVGALAREPIAALLGVEEHPWASAGALMTGAIWLLLCLLRGVLQGLRAYRPVAASIVLEAGGRIVAGLVLVGVGLDVTGAFLGTPIVLALLAAWLWRDLHARLPEAPTVAEHPRPLASLLGDNRVAILGLLLLAGLQNVDVIVARRELDEDLAGSYAACAVAAKAVVWVAVGVGLSLLPEAAKRAQAGHDPRPVLLRALAILGALAVPALLIFAVASEPLLTAAFGEELAVASGALPLLGGAMVLLAVAYLTIQLLVALGDTRHVLPLLALVIAEPVVLSAGSPSPERLAAIVLAFQVVAAGLALALGLRRRAAWHAAPV